MNRQMAAFGLVLLFLGAASRASSQSPGAPGQPYVVASDVGATSSAPSDPWPADTGLVNVRTDPHCALAGDGSTDDTAALQSCIEYWTDHDLRAGLQEQAAEMLFFPSGTYLLSDQIVWRDADGNERAYLGFWGESRAGVVFELADHAKGFDDPGRPKAIFYVGDQRGLRGEAYHNNLRNFTIRIGAGNPGAVGIDYVGNNKVDVRDLKIESPSRVCHVGLYSGRAYSGPLLFKDIEVDGCRYGVLIEWPMASITAENITVTNQLLAGVAIDRQVVSLRNLVSVQGNDVPALRVTNRASPGSGPLVTVLGGTLSGPGDSATSSAIEILPADPRTNDPRVLLRDIRTAGYAGALTDRGNAIAGDALAEYRTHGPTSVFPSTEHTLGLPLPDHPHMVHPNPLDWRSITFHGAAPDDDGDDLAAIQAAIDSGKRVVYCPKGRWEISGTIVLRGSIERLVGYDCLIRPHGSGPDITPVFLVDASLDHDVELDGIDMVRQNQSQRAFANPRTLHRSPHDLIATNVAHLTRYESVPGAGDFYAENIAHEGIWLRGNALYCRQCDIETTEVPKLWVDGGTAVILGLKTENPRTPLVRAENGGRVEILSAHHSGDPQGVAPGPLYEVRDSQLVASYATMVDAFYDPQATVTRGTSTRSLERAAVEARGHGSVNILFIERPLAAGDGD